MNIDVREYLRINPISVHELTLSDNGRDCFLMFSLTEEDAQGNPTYRGFTACTQDQLFKGIYKAIFGDLVEFDSTGKPKIHKWNGSQYVLSDIQFAKYARGIPVRKYMRQYKNAIDELDKQVELCIWDMRERGILDYDGAVELQSKASRLYEDFNNAIGHIWCYDGDGKNLKEGADLVTAGDLPVYHIHASTRAETTTRPISTNKFGSDLVGEYKAGDNSLVANVDVSNNANVSLSPTTPPAMGQRDLTYPLYGQNMLDWRVPRREHNNVPPSINILVKYRELQSDSSNLNSLQENTSMTYGATLRNLGRFGAKAQSRNIGDESADVVKYKSSMVCELDEYLPENLTATDCLLRMVLDNSTDDVDMRKQGLQMLLDSFTTIALRDITFFEGENLDYQESTTLALQEILNEYLDNTLMNLSEFSQWMREMTSKLGSLNEKIATLNELLVAVKPITYEGRIIVSTKDDTEQKVIANYGGKRWRRIVNFLRGVDGTDDVGDERLGRRFGEAYVCLRESNIPIHAHGENVKDTSDTHGIDTARRNMQFDTQGVETKLVSEKEDGSQQASLENVDINYQMGALEYDKDATYPIPHDNMPPNLRVYIWECLETETYGISYDLNGYNGTHTNTKDSYKTEDATFAPEPPSEVDGQLFTGWSPPDVHPGSMGDKTFVAQWLTVYTISYQMNPQVEGVEILPPEDAWTTYTEKSEDYTPPPPTVPDDYEYEFDKWTIWGTEDTVLPSGSTGDKIFLANWKRKPST